MRPKRTVKEHYDTIQAAMDSRRTASQCFADAMTQSFGTVQFFVAHIVVFVAWGAINFGIIPWIPIFDPFPFSFITMIVSLEAIFLSIIVLMSQNRASSIANLREELDFHINVQAEQEITRLIGMVDEIHDHLGLDPADDDELKHMKERTDVGVLEQELVDELKDV